jgi:hypothetical protein
LARYEVAMIALMQESSGVPIYRLKITLKGSQPKIWRRFLVRADMKLPQFHKLLQAVMGWTDSHLHQFVLKSGQDRVFIGVPDPDFDPGWSTEVLNEKRFRVADLFSTNHRKIFYEYDFGDGWEHEILLEKVLTLDPKFKRSMCLAGKNACPPEDCGGIWNYHKRFLKALNDPKHKDHEMYKEWIGGSWDPSRFDVDEVNEYLKTLKL